MFSQVEGEMLGYPEGVRYPGGEVWGPFQAVEDGWWVIVEEEVETGMSLWWPGQVWGQEAWDHDNTNLN